MPENAHPAEPATALWPDTALWSAGAPFGRLITAMVTPFHEDGSLDLDGAQKLAAHLVDAGNDGLVVSGTTGEAPTTSAAEQLALLEAVREAVGDRAHVIAGVGTNSTEHTLALARQAEAAADALLVVTPYYNKPTQEGLYRHFTAVAGHTSRPVVLYDIPHRTGVPIEVDTLKRLGEHEMIVAVKDAKGDLVAGSEVIAATDLAYYSGDDPLTLPWLSVGAVGVVSMSAHLAAPRIRAMIAAYLAGDVREAARLHAELLPVHAGVTSVPGVISLKAAMNMLGLPGGPVRLPLVEATEEQLARLKTYLAQGGVKI
ncbi:4-hydroxy-tetrahydrodipicolinate synthase [Catenulispora sp. NF23]|uniref:4-hydroxy-tetrahydrodipicolinate synthase n=1 Tax=Catenulispora pinistramenti TaxID=2705254 RepID=A0ABS5L1C7_9ACTN|nr:4-hydroxy-tetrahydrodipicolinate synthase [Catenulispora pinistramenti]MBS2538822.1 4-hydroxy-tetrahydrodipicolinate synthase [Catenulispora pinistramenti]MBS2552133.1 4-hydroxy-tetrahydrodipicolinate synthase [Catenulispora pinistramenti]